MLSAYFCFKSAHWSQRATTHTQKPDLSCKTWTALYPDALSDKAPDQQLAKKRKLLGSETQYRFLPECAFYLHEWTRHPKPLKARSADRNWPANARASGWSSKSYAVLHFQPGLRRACAFPSDLTFRFLQTATTPAREGVITPKTCLLPTFFVVFNKQTVITVAVN